MVTAHRCYLCRLAMSAKRHYSQRLCGSASTMTTMSRWWCLRRRPRARRLPQQATGHATME